MILLQSSNQRMSRHQGSAILILLILLSIATVLTVCNQMTLRRLVGELNLLEKRQQQRYSPPSKTNTVEALRPNSTNGVANPTGKSTVTDFNPSVGGSAR